MAAKKSTTRSAFPRVAFESDCKRIRVVAEAAHDYVLYCDDKFSGSFTMAIEAEHEGAVWLHEQMADEAIELADEAADRATDEKPARVAPVHDQFQNVIIELQASGAMWVSIGEKDTKLSRAEVVALYMAFHNPRFAAPLHGILEDHLCATGGPALQAVMVNAA
jgi:hypothetical protein